MKASLRQTAFGGYLLYWQRLWKPSKKFFDTPQMKPAQMQTTQKAPENREKRWIS
jgi:hypothetical protein